MQSPTPAATRLAAFVSSAIVPDTARATARDAVLDTVGVMLAGATEPAAQIVQRVGRAHHDHLGVAVTDSEGRFVIRFTEDRFQDIIESEPDIYLKVFDKSGKREVYATRDKVRYNASRKEKFKLRVPARNLGL